MYGNADAQNFIMLAYIVFWLVVLGYFGWLVRERKLLRQQLEALRDKS